MATKTKYVEHEQAEKSAGVRLYLDWLSCVIAQTMLPFLWGCRGDFITLWCSLNSKLNPMLQPH